MANIFEQTIVPKIPFSNFPLSETQLITHNFGQLVPCFVREIVPNDVFSLSAYVDCEFAPMVAPMKQDCHLSIHFFFCPDRILFDGFETFITGSEDGHALTTEAELARMPSQPGMTLLNFASFFNDSICQGTLLDYLGLPNEVGKAVTAEDGLKDLVISDIPLRAYFKCWYDYYRDENLQYDFESNHQTHVRTTYYDFWRDWRAHSNPLDGDYSQYIRDAFLFDLDSEKCFLPFYRSFKKDYFTGALQSPQKGEPVTISLGTDAPITLKQGVARVIGTGNLSFGSLPSDRLRITPVPGVGNNGDVKVDSRGYLSWANNDPDNPQSGDFNSMTGSFEADPLNLVGFDSDEEPVEGFPYVANLAKASAITVEALREAFAVQEILESLSIRGSRFVEFLRGNFGVVPDDYRLQRPQFLGGLVTPVAIQKILQTSGYSGADSRDMTGYAAGRAFAGAGQNVFRQRFKEHGYIIGIMSVMPKAYYYQGIPRHFMRRDRFDYYLPQTAHLGEQPIENIELYLDNQSNHNFDVFGYIPRWAEYKVSTNGIHGDFRGNLNYYHMARVFSQLPTLSEEFITTQNVQTRPFAVWQAENPSINHLIWTTCFFRVTGSRPIPYHSLPKVQ